MSTAERLRHAGRQDTVLKLMAARFKGHVTPEVERLVRQADAARLDRWIDAIFTAVSLDELLSHGATPT